MKRTFLATLLVTLVCSLAAMAQDNTGGSDLEKQLQKISGAAGKSYAGPIVNGFGTNFNGGWFHGAPPAKIFGIDLQFGIVAMGTPFKDDAKTFATSGSFRFSREQAGEILQHSPNYGSIPAGARTSIIDQIAAKDFEVDFEGPTVIGTPYVEDHRVPGDEVTAKFKGGQFVVPGFGTYTVAPDTKGLQFGGLDGLSNLSMLPLGAPQVSIGTVYGTQATFRYLPEMKLTDAVGKVKYFGWGVTHNVSMWLPMVPVDISASFFKQKLNLDPYVEATGTAYGLTVSKCFSAAGLVAATPYVGFMLEKSNMKFTYNQTGTFVVNGVTVQQLPVEFAVDGANTSRLMLGASFKLLFFNINADYNIGKYNSFTGGLMFII